MSCPHLEKLVFALITQNDEPWIKPAEIESLLALANETTAWLTKQQAAQQALKPSEDPVLKSSVVALKAAKLGDQEEKLNRLLQELAWEAVGSFLASVEASGETEIVFERTTPANQAPPRSGKYGPQRPPNAITPRAFAKPGSRPYTKPFNAAKPKRAKG